MGKRVHLFYLVIGGLVLLLTMVAIWFVISRPADNVNEINIPAPTPTPSNRNLDSGSFKKVSSIPEKLKQTPQIVKYQMGGKDYIRADAVVLKIPQKQKNYLVKLDTGETVNVILDNKTILQKAFFNLDQKGEIQQVIYEPIQPARLDEVIIGKKVRVLYAATSLKNNKIPALEFVLIED